jgi:hypothetical protein
VKAVEGGVAGLLELTVDLLALACPVFEFSPLELLIHKLIFEFLFEIVDLVFQVSFESEQPVLRLVFNLIDFLFGDDFGYGFEFLYRYIVCFLFLIARFVY